MAFDQTYVLVDAALSGANSQAILFQDADNDGFTTDGGNSVPLGRVGLPKGAQFTVILDNPGGAGTAAKPVVCSLQLTLDNETTWRNIATISLGDFEDGFQGQITTGIERSFAWEQYADTNIQLRFLLTPSGANTEQSITADKLAAYITQGEVTKWGRVSTADTLFVE